MPRKNNIQDMSISEQIEAIKVDICDKYCRFPQTAHEKWLNEEVEDRDEYLQEKYCKNCPLTRL